MRVTHKRTLAPTAALLNCALARLARQRDVQGVVLGVRGGLTKLSATLDRGPPSQHLKNALDPASAIPVSVLYHFALW